ncbi:hypothetical protein T12_6584, partial [Trichinella patagoniensis]
LQNSASMNTILVASLFLNILLFITRATEIGDHCNKSEQCHGQMMCAEQFCTPAEPTDTVCGQQRDCKANQICKYGVCWKAAGKRLGEPCLLSSECENAYSHCKNGVCTCRPQFINHRGLCEPGARNCPLDFPLIQNGRLFQCIIDEQRLDGQIDNCPKDFFCVADTVQNTQTQNVLNKNLKGFCCPKMASVCPVGSAYSAADMDCYRFCPRETHHCYRGGDFKWRPTCCPIPCSAGYVNQNGYCVSASSPKSLTQAFKELNKECNDDRDCTSKNFICKDFKCQCNEHYYFNGFECVVPKCRYGIPMFNNDGTPVRCETICPKKLNICDKTYKICCDLSQVLLGIESGVK